MQFDVCFSCVWFLIDNEFCDNIVKVIWRFTNLENLWSYYDEIHGQKQDRLKKNGQQFVNVRRVAKGIL